MNSESGEASAAPALEQFQANSLSVSLTVADLQKSMDWYRDVLGFTIERVYERGGPPFAAALQAGAVKLLLTRDDGSKGADRAKGVGFSIQLTTDQNVDAIAARAKAKGAVLATEPADAWGARVFRLRDPDGFLLVISSERR